MPQVDVWARGERRATGLRRQVILDLGYGARLGGAERLNL